MKSVFPFAAKDLIVCGLGVGFFFFFIFMFMSLLQLPFTMRNSILDLAFYVVTDTFTSVLGSAGYVPD